MSSSTRSTTTATPPEWAEPGYRLSGSEAMRLYENGSGGNVFDASTVAPQSQETMAGIGALSRAGQNWNTAGTRPAYTALQGHAASTNPQQDYQSAWNASTGMGQLSTDLFRPISTGVDRINTGGMFADIYDSAGGPSAAEQYLGNYASGANLQGDGNPFFRQRLESDLADTAAQVRSSMSGAGRYGSNVSNRVLADELGRKRVAALENDWNREQANQFNAVGMIDQGRRGGIADQLAAASGLTGVQGQNIANQMSAGSNEVAAQSDMAGQLRAIQDAIYGQQNTAFDQAMGATNAIAGLDQRNFDNSMTGANALLDAGRMQDQYNQSVIMDDVNRFYALDNQDWTRLGLFQSANAGAAGPYGTEQATSRTSNPMAAIGALGSLFGGKSDRRVKKDVRRVGTLDNGVPIYAFKYLDSDETVLGVMAQEVVETHPDAVIMEADGFYRVDYDEVVKEAA